jgi:hypothetical protein
VRNDAGSLFAIERGLAFGRWKLQADAMRVTWLCAWVLATNGVALSARADDRVTLVYLRESEECPAAPVVRDLIVARLGRDPFSSSGPSATFVVIRARQTESGGQAEFHVAVEGALSTPRAVEGASCEDAITTAALGIALAVEPVLGEPAIAVSDAATAVERARSPPPDVPPPDATSDGFDLVPGARGEILLSFGLLSSAALGGRALATARFGAFELGLGAMGASASGGPLDAWIVAGTASLCLRHSFFAGCAAFDAGSLAASSPEVVSPKLRGVAYLGVEASAEAEIELVSSVAAFVRVGALASLLGADFLIDGQRVFRSPPLAVVLGLGARFELR